MAIENKSYDEFCEILNKKINLGELITIEENLENLGMKDKTLEDFLEEEGIFQRMSKTEKLEKVGELKNFYSKRRGSGASEKSKLLESYRIILNDINKEKEYDNYLKKAKYVGVNQILKNSKEVYKRDGILRLNQIENYVSQINLKIKNESDARNIFYGFCRQEGIPFNPERNYQNEKNMKNNWKPNNYSNSDSNNNNTEEDHKNTWKNRENNNEWNPNENQKKSGNSAAWVIVGILAIVIALLIFVPKNTSKSTNISKSDSTQVSQQSKEPEKTDEGNSSEISEGGNTEQSNNDVDNQNNNTDNQDENTQDSANLSEDAEFIADGTARLIDDRGEEVDVEISGNIDRYTTLVIKNLKKSRYLKMMSHTESGNLIPLGGRIFKFRCGEHATIENGKLVVDAEDVASYRSKDFVNSDTNLRDGKCITAPGSEVNKEMDTSDID